MIKIKKIGLIGGLGPESTLEYYKFIVDYFKNESLNFPEIIIYSANIGQLFLYVEKKEWSNLTNWLLEIINNLKASGAEFVAIASNTPHIVFDELSIKSPLPIVSIVDSTLNCVKRDKVMSVGLLGTQLTMSSGYYSNPFERNGITVITPSIEEQDLIQNKLETEIELGIIKDSTRKLFLKIINRMKEEYKIESLILGCTELPLILDQSMCEVKLYDTSYIHCQEIIKYSIS